MLPVLISHLRFHKCLDHLEEKLRYTFKNRQLLQVRTVSAYLWLSTASAVVTPFLVPIYSFSPAENALLALIVVAVCVRVVRADAPVLSLRHRELRYESGPRAQLALQLRHATARVRQQVRLDQGAPQARYDGTALMIVSTKDLM